MFVRSLSGPGRTSDPLAPARLGWETPSRAGPPRAPAFGARTHSFGGGPLRNRSRGMTVL
eukprot:8036847-Alexandrium_andersonii.AAC.1